MSLNRFEQRVFDYWKAHRDERQYWQGKVQTIARASSNATAAAGLLAADLWRYYRERSAAVPNFEDPALGAGAQRMSMRNLAELLLRTWTELPPPPPRPLPPGVTRYQGYEGERIVN